MESLEDLSDFELLTKHRLRKDSQVDPCILYDRQHSL